MLAARLSVVVVATVLLSSCISSDDAVYEVPAEVRTATTVLGDGADVVAGVHVSSLYRSFLSELEHVGSTGMRWPTDELRTRLLDNLGIDPNDEDVTIVGSLTRGNGEMAPRIVISAPLPAGKLERLAADLDGVERLDVRLPQGADGASSDLPVYAVRDGNGTILVAQPARGILVATTSTSSLAEMILRARAESEAAAPGAGALLERVAGEDAWFIIPDVPGAVESVSRRTWSADEMRILRAVRSAAGSIRMEDHAALLTLYLEPLENVEPDDLSDLVRGVLALIKMNVEKQGQEELADIVEDVDVAEVGGRTRVRLSVTESRLEELLRRYRYSP